MFCFKSCRVLHIVTSCNVLSNVLSPVMLSQESSHVKPCYVKLSTVELCCKSCHAKWCGQSMPGHVSSRVMSCQVLSPVKCTSHDEVSMICDSSNAGCVVSEMVQMYRLRSYSRSVVKLLCVGLSVCKSNLVSCRSVDNNNVWMHTIIVSLFTSLSV